MLATATDYNQVMRDIPLNELMSAADIEGIRVALVNIFASVKKIRNTKYPAKRAIEFFSSISTDTQTQLTKVTALRELNPLIQCLPSQVIRPRRLMHMPLSELDEIMAGCTKVFTFWDDEQDKLQQIFRDMAKKQKMEVKYALRITTRHKNLEMRLNDLHKFRKQHEQLASVISRVLHSSGQKNALDSGGQMSPDKQVAKAYDDVKEVEYLDISKEGVSLLLGDWCAHSN